MKEKEQKKKKREMKWMKCTNLKSNTKETNKHLLKCVLISFIFLSEHNVFPNYRIIWLCSYISKKKMLFLSLFFKCFLFHENKFQLQSEI